MFPSDFDIMRAGRIRRELAQDGNASIVELANQLTGERRAECGLPLAPPVGPQPPREWPNVLTEDDDTDMGGLGDAPLDLQKRIRTMQSRVTISLSDMRFVRMTGIRVHSDTPGVALPKVDVLGAPGWLRPVDGCSADPDSWPPIEHELIRHYVDNDSDRHCALSKSELAAYLAFCTSRTRWPCLGKDDALVVGVKVVAPRIANRPFVEIVNGE